MSERVEIAGLKVDQALFDFVNDEALPGTGIAQLQFWTAFGAIVAELTPVNRALLEERDALQGKIDTWNRRHGGAIRDVDAYTAFLKEIGYIAPEGPAFSVGTENVDPEIGVVAGPQLVVPIINARYALNAANARWGSLYDALYGTDALGERPTAAGYDPERGQLVVAWARRFSRRLLAAGRRQLVGCNRFFGCRRKAPGCSRRGTSQAEVARRFRRSHWCGVCTFHRRPRQQRLAYSRADRPQ